MKTIVWRILAIVLMMVLVFVLPVFCLVAMEDQYYEAGVRLSADEVLLKLPTSSIYFLNLDYTNPRDFHYINTEISRTLNLVNDSMALHSTYMYG